MNLMHEERRMAAAMDLRVRQLESTGIDGTALIDGMVGYLPDLQRIWTTTSDETLASLCQEYPGFYRYAHLMENAAEAQRKRSASGSNPNSEIQELPESLKRTVSKLLVDAATIERGLQGVLDASLVRGTPSVQSEPNAVQDLKRQVSALDTLNRQWTSDLARFSDDIRKFDVPQPSRVLLITAFERMTETIDPLNKSIATTM